MILHSLYKLYDRLAEDANYDVAKLGYTPQNISFRVVLKPDGTLFAIQDARIQDEKGKFRAQKTIVYGDGKRSGSTPKPFVTWDNALYLLGLPPIKEINERGEDEAWKWAYARFEASKSAHIKLAKQTSNEFSKLVANFFETWSPDLCREHSQLREICSNFGTFSVQGELGDFCHDPAILEFFANQKKESSQGLNGQCLVTGKSSIIARLHPTIKGVTAPEGKQQKNGPLVSMDKNSFNSYGKTQAYNAPVSELAAFKYGTALNSLLNGSQSSKHRIRLGDTTCVFWTDKSSIVEDVFSFFAQDGSNAQDDSARLKIEIFLKSLRHGINALDEFGEDTINNNFYLLGLAPNAARLSIRFFHKSSISDFIENLRSHHQDIEIVREYDGGFIGSSEQAEFPSNRDLLNQTAVRLSSGKLDYKSIPPLLAGALMRSILNKTNYPEGIYSAVLRRIRLDRTINYYRAAILKGTLIRNHNQKIPIMLDTENKDQAYLLGRLFATLEKTQDDALGTLNAGLRDKYYSSASATPASVFPRIIRTYQHHLSKLSGGQKVNRDRLTQEIISEFTAFPNHLNNKEQGLFAIGYYHQRKQFFTKKETPSDTTETK